MIKRIIVFSLFTVFCAKGQTLLCIQVSKKPLTADRFIGVDDFNAIYYIDDQVFYREKERTIIPYNNLQMGAIGTVDILNPLEITLFYPDFNTAIKLDNTLNEIVAIDFNTLRNFRNVQYISTANDKNLWIFNADLQQLEILNYQTQEIISINQPLNQEVIAQKSNYNFCWLLTKKKLLKYNIYGSLLYVDSLEGYEDISVRKGHMVLKKSNRLFYKKEEAKAVIPLTLSDIPVKDFYINANNLYIYDGENIYHYQLNFQ